MELDEDSEPTLADFIDRRLAGMTKKKPLRLNGTTFIAAYLQLVIKSQDFKQVHQSFQERLRHLSFLVHLLCRYDDFDSIFQEYKIVQADLEDNVTNWDDYEYFRKWEIKVLNKFRIIDDDHTYNESLPESCLESNIKEEDDKEWNPKKINITRKKGRKKGKKGSSKTNCPICNKAVKNKELHMKNVHSEESHPCSECDYIGKSAYYTKKHAERVHSNTSSPGRKINRKKKTNNVLRCGQCEFSCAKDTALQEHQFTAHGQILTCEPCNMNFDDLETYSFHIKKHTVACDICGKSIQESGIQKHMDLMHGELSEQFEVCPECGISIKTASIAAHIKKVHTSNLKACTFCDYSAKTEYDLNRHIKRKHTESTVVNCPWCGRLTKDLDRHLRNNQCNIPEHERTNTTKFECDQCGKQFRQQKTLINHFRAVHEKIKDFKCDQCSYRTTTNFNLKIHVRRVHERKPLKEMCPHCDKAFMNIEWHINTYHGELLANAVKAVE